MFSWQMPLMFRNSWETPPNGVARAVQVSDNISVRTAAFWCSLSSSNNLKHTHKKHHTVIMAFKIFLMHFTNNFTTSLFFFLTYKHCCFHKEIQIWFPFTILYISHRQGICYRFVACYTPDRRPSMHAGLPAALSTCSTSVYHTLGYKPHSGTDL